MSDLDVLARAAVERAQQEVISVDVPRAHDVTARRATAHRRRRAAVAALATVVVVVGGGVVVAAATRSDDSTQPGIAVAATVPANRHSLEFREMFSVKDFAGCRVTEDNPHGQAVLPDRDHHYCYVVGPVVLDGSSVDSADAVLNPNTSEWEVDVHFKNDDFVAKVATPYLNKEIAIVDDEVVLSAPMINPGITGRDISMSGAFDQAGAEHLARGLAPGRRG